MTTTNNSTFGIHISSTSNEEVQMGDMRISLLASGDGVEVIRHKMPPNSQWTILRETEQGEFQHYFLVHGELHWKSECDRGVLLPGQSLTHHLSDEVVELYACRDSEFLLFSSIPLFQRHVSGLRDLEGLAVSIEEKDGYTADHCSRIRDISMRMADILDLSPSNKFDLKIGSFLHDLGKVRIPPEILNKPGALTSDEWRIMKLHPIYGKDLLTELNQYCLLGAARVIEQHHERYNASGYPFGLDANEIHFGAAIVAVADSFDAMTTDRVYSKAKSMDAAIQELKQTRGVLYHPDVIDAFLSYISSYM